MSPRANIAVFKSKTLALIDTLKLEPGDVVGLGLTLAVSYAITSGIRPDALHAMLDQSLADASADAEPGILRQ